MSSKRARIDALKRQIQDLNAQLEVLEAEIAAEVEQAAYVRELERVQAGLADLSAREAELRAAAADGDGSERCAFRPETDAVISLRVGPSSFAPMRGPELSPGVVVAKVCIDFVVEGEHSTDIDGFVDECTPQLLRRITIPDCAELRCGSWPALRAHLCKFLRAEEQEQYLVDLCSAHREWYDSDDNGTNEGKFAGTADVFVFIRRGVLDDECLLPLGAPDAKQRRIESCL